MKLLGLLLFGCFSWFEMAEIFLTNLKTTIWNANILWYLETSSRRVNFNSILIWKRNTSFECLIKSLKKHLINRNYCYLVETIAFLDLNIWLGSFMFSSFVLLSLILLVLPSKVVESMIITLNIEHKHLWFSIVFLTVFVTLCR